MLILCNYLYWFLYFSYLKQVRKNREEETELMKDVDGWVVGTWYGERPYRLKPADALLPPNHHEFFAHVDRDTFYKWIDYKVWA